MKNKLEVCIDGVKYVPFIEVEETYKITKEQILHLANTFGNDSETRLRSYIVSDLKKMFPKAFEQDKVELPKEGEYWLHSTGSLVLVLGVTKCHGGTVKCKHIDNTENFSFHGICTMDRKATHQEIEEALRNEAVRREFNQGCCFNILNGNKGVVNIFCVPKFIYDDYENKLLMNGWCIFLKGIWAKPFEVKPMTQPEIETELGYKIKIVD